MSLNDHFDLQRFLTAQNRVVDGKLTIFDLARAELQAGRKQSHWIWFIFPQFKGLGLSETSKKFAIRSIEEADAFLGHTVLGPRLIECTEIVVQLEDLSISQIFGDVDGMKFCSSMTLFARTSTKSRAFREALRKYFDDRPDQLTLNLL
jgi:uncharacterized protein (DUF1810 family)